jgi:peptidoglycan/LPS O-acetylase OafA/YrhL
VFQPEADMKSTAITGRHAVGALPQLDGLRGLAILGVMFHHFAEFAGKAWPGWLGVELFFVLSGFLITRILLAERDRASNRRRTVAIFYARRALRILPIYFVTLGILWAIDFPQARQLGWWFGTYTYNWYAGTVEWSGSYAHFWSLCVEEQFYLAWPLVALFCPRRLLAPSMIAIAMMGPIWRIACAAAGTSRVPLIVMPFASFDCLAVGSLLALYATRDYEGTTAAQRFHRVCRLGGIALMSAWVFCMVRETPITWHRMPLERLIGNSAMALFFAWIVRRAATGQRGDLGALLQMAWLRYLGRISYGIYICHMFVPRITNSLLTNTHGFVISPLWVNMALSVGIASLSWYLIESKVNGLKRFLNYTTEPKSASPVARRARVVRRWPSPIFRGP